MNKVSAVSFIVAALIFGVVAGFGITNLTDDNTCYEEAITVAADAEHTTDRLAEYTVDTLVGIMQGVPHNEAELERIADSHNDIRDEISDIEDRCG